ncbi:MAG: serine hydrolase domain-containing protein, partial [Desulfobacterales bacterium]|nr:serine hydrolase domain-containing protein [Desulfobacterales bacterium]
MAYRDLPGMTIGIVHDQTIIYLKGFGYADRLSRKPSTPDSIYRIGSISKLFTAIAIMQLRDEGKLDLDDPVRKYLPWFALKNSFPAGPAITIRHLLTHSSGLPREAGSAYWIDMDFPTSRQVRDRLARQKTIYPPEKKLKYSNLALALAGEIVAAISGTSFADHVTRRILRPLGMMNTSVALPQARQQMLATGYGRRMPDNTRETFAFVDARGMAAATGFSSSVHDMTKFVSWQLRLLGSNETEILKPGTLREMQRVHWPPAGLSGGRGLGFDVLGTKDRQLIGHGGGYPGYQTAAYISPKEKLGVIVFANSLDTNPYPGTPLSITDRIFSWIAPAVGKARKGRDVPEAPLAWKRLQGVYRSLWSDIHILPLEGKLMLIDPTIPEPKSAAMTLEPFTPGT